MYLYDTDWNDADAPRRIDAESVDAWMRAAAYAAGDDPELVLSPGAGSKSAQAEQDLAG
ncbi:MAG TPA: hypothetical protein VMU79_02670 [Casimicrobiaceae bacterium]|jgi:hypothetical protein|nr:hypothetical protein [Casimicrobiaceae bacterium]